jgi:hypothetical protein
VKVNNETVFVTLFLFGKAAHHPEDIIVFAFERPNPINLACEATAPFKGTKGTSHHNANSILKD